MLNYTYSKSVSNARNIYLRYGDQVDLVTCIWQPSSPKIQEGSRRRLSNVKYLSWVYIDDCGLPAVLVKMASKCKPILFHIKFSLHKDLCLIYQLSACIPSEIIIRLTIIIILKIFIFFCGKLTCLYNMKRLVGRKTYFHLFLTLKEVCLSFFTKGKSAPSFKMKKLSVVLIVRTPWTIGLFKETY